MRVRHLKLDIHLQIANCQSSVKHVAQGGRFRVKQHWIGTEFGQIDRGSPAKSKGFCRDRVDRVFEQIVKLEFCRTLHFDAYSKVDFPPANTFKQVCCGEFAEADTYPRIVRLKRSKRAGQYRRCDCGDARERQRSSLDVDSFANFSK